VAALLSSAIFDKGRAAAYDDAGPESMIIAEQRRKFLRFLAVGLLNSAFSYSVYALLIFLGVHYALAVLVANVLGVLFNFKTTGRLVFQSHDNRLIFKFVLVYASVYLVSVSSLKILLWLGLNRYLAGALIALPMAGLTFTLMSRFVFKKRPVDPA
jgi:putative flippase GtrA